MVARREAQTDPIASLAPRKTTIVVSVLGAATRQSDALSAAYLECGGVLPVEVRDGRMVIATWRDDVDVQVLDDLAILFDSEVILERHNEDDIRTAIRRLYARDATAQGVIDAVAPSSGIEGDAT